MRRMGVLLGLTVCSCALIEALCGADAVERVHVAICDPVLSLLGFTIYPFSTSALVRASLDMRALWQFAGPPGRDLS